MSFHADLLRSDWWTLLVQQAWQFTLLVVMAAVLTRCCCKNRPRIAHALWAIVLLKCLIPPVFSSSLSPFSFVSSLAFSRTIETSTPQSIDSMVVDRRSEQSWTRWSGASVATDAEILDDEAGELVLEDLSTESQSATSGPAQTVATSDGQLARMVVSIWLLGTCVLFAWIATRLWFFVRKIHRCGQRPDPRTSQLLQSTIAQMGLGDRRIANTRVHVVDSLIGPAAIGFFRPRILLPRVLESECSECQLQMLLAHELTHIRRGDVWWAAVQTMASCCMWFHPLIRCVSRCFDRVTELSCDEEVVARLKCKPSDYARSLLLVLERKHQLRTAPALPGVRPVQITSERIERIMRLDSQAKRPRRWPIALIWIVGIVTVVPGAGWLVAQEAATIGSTQDQAVPAARSRSWQAAPIPPQPLPRHSTNSSDEVVVRKLNASDALEKIVEEDQCDPTRAALILNATLDTITMSNARVIVDGEQVIARGTKEQLNEIESELDRIAEHGFRKQIVIATRICTIPKKLFDELSMRWTLVQHERNQQPVLAALTEFNELQAAIASMQQSPQSNVVSAPKVTTFNGRQATIESGVQRPFVVKGDTENSTENTEIRVEQEGFKLWVRPLDESHYTSLEMRLTLSRIDSVDTFTYRDGGETSRTVQVPRVIEQEAKLKISIPKQQSVVLAMPSVEDSDRMLIACITPALITEEELSRAKPPATAVLPSPSPQVAPASYQSMDVARPAAIQPAAAIIPPPAQSSTTWWMKADGPPTSDKVVDQCTELFASFDARPRLVGNWQLESDDKTTTLSGKNLALATPDEDRLTCPDGRFIVNTTEKAITLQADQGTDWNAELFNGNLMIQAATIQFGEAGLQATGDALHFEVRATKFIHPIHGRAERLLLNRDENLQLEGAVTIEFDGHRLTANRANLISGDPSRIELRGDVHVVGDSRTEIRTSALDIDLPSGRVRFPD